MSTAPAGRAPAPAGWRGSVLWSCAVSLALACAFSVLLGQSLQIRHLRAELAELRQRAGAGPGTAGAGARAADSSEPGRHPSPPDSWGAKRKGILLERNRRQTGQDCSQRRRSFLHLLPLSTHSYDEDDSTSISWGEGYRQGRGLQVSGETVTVKTGGLYHIYSQVLYGDHTFAMGHVIKKNLHGNETILMKCSKNMPDSEDKAFSSCYSAGVFYLESGSVVELSVLRKDARLKLEPYYTYLGLYRI
ncbi:tumor necrosis factor ligand superfamily member 13 [Lepisosteus oculatus]